MSYALNRSIINRISRGRNAIRKFAAILFIFIFMLQSGPFVYPSQASPLNLLVEEARKNNPEIQAAKKRWEAAQARLPQAKSLDDPSIGLTFMKIPKGTLKINRAMSEDRLLSASQMFPFLGKLSLKGKIALAESQMAASEYKDKELEIINAVKNAYYDLFMNYREAQLNQQSLLFLENIAKNAEAKYVVGEIMQEDLFKINLEIAKLSNTITNLKQERLAKQTRLNTLLNRDPESPQGEPQLSEGVYFDYDIASLYKFTLQNQPELLIFAYAIEKNKYAKSLAKRSFFPDLMANIAFRGITAGSIGPWDLMLAFTVPLWFWTKQRYEIKEAISNLKQAEAVYAAMKNKALFKTKELFTKIEIAKNKIELYKNNQIPLVESSIASSLSAYRSGKGDIMMLLDSQRMLIETKMNYYNALVEYNMNLADLERAVGIPLSNKTEVQNAK